MKVCEVCGQEWRPATRHQSKRNRTCGPICNAALISKGRFGKGKKSEDQKAGKMISCAMCGKMFWRHNSHIKKNMEQFCSRHCAGLRRSENLVKFSGNMKGRERKDKKYGATNPAWKGGVTYWRKHGNYKPIKYVRCPSDLLPMARKDGYIMEHRLIMARHLGRLLKRTEVVHHINHDPHDNRIENLELFSSNGEHKRVEWQRLKSAPLAEK